VAGPAVAAEKHVFWKKKFELMRDHKLEAQVRQAAL
jgi:hypothetical protein